MASYERYFNHLIKQAQTNAAAYTNQRRRQADEDAQEIRDEYRTADRAAVEQSRLSLAQTEAEYRKAYDAGAVSEAVARRNAAEALANSQLTNSGLNATQQTAISLVRSRADSDLTLRKQAAVERIVRELDTVRAQYRKQSAEETAAIYKQAQADMQTYEAEQTTMAQKQAQAMADADVKAAKQAAEMSLLEMKANLAAQEAQRKAAAANAAANASADKPSSNTSSDKSSSSTSSNKSSSSTSNKKTSSSSSSNKTSSSSSKKEDEKKAPATTTPTTQSVLYKAYENVPSKTAIEVNAATKKKQGGDLEAASYLRKCVNEGLITAEERGEIMTKNGIREPQQFTREYVNGMVDRMLKNGDKSDARIFMDMILEKELIDPNEIRDVIQKVYQ